MITMRFTTGFGSGSVLPATTAACAPAGIVNSQTLFVKIDAFVLPDVIAATSGSTVLGRSAHRAGAARGRSSGRVTPSTVIVGQTV